ncbi:hypothetical protein Dimus_007326 [Dionaea muscipula]
MTSLESRKDFLLYVGGLIWALDWCPRPKSPECHTCCEFIAVSAHPPDSTYHKMGVLLSGRGMVQIWCLISSNEDREIVPGPTRAPKRKFVMHDGAKEEEAKPKRPRGRPKKKEKETQPKNKEEETQPKRRRGRPRKNPILMVNDACENQFIEALAIKQPDCSLNSLPMERFFSGDAEAITSSSKENLEVEARGRNDKVNVFSTQNESAECALACVEKEGLSQYDRMSDGNGASAFSTQNKSAECALACVEKEGLSQNDRMSDGNGAHAFSTQNESAECALACVEKEGLSQNDRMPDRNGANDGCSTSSSTAYATSKNAILPRAVLCIGHDGKVAWDVKWKPCASEPRSKQRMGYLAVVLGNGSTEVWEIPSLRMTRAIFSSQHKEGIDPRFLKLKPVFRCSKLKYGDRHSMPLIVEWSASPPHDLLLVGCHDGMVALWKFFPIDSSEETRPLLCFSADTVPIRALSWAPSEGDAESSNVIVIAGHEGLKFWDLR